MKLQGKIPKKVEDMKTVAQSSETRTRSEFEDGCLLGYGAL
jgi:hypothetical protein